LNRPGFAGAGWPETGQTAPGVPGGGLLKLPPGSHLPFETPLIR